MGARRRGRSSSKAPRQRRDWVYRTSTTNEDQPPIGSYQALFQTVTSGFANAAAWILYDSKDFLSNMENEAVGGFAVQVGSERRAEGARPRIYAVEAQVTIINSVWALGATQASGFRLGVFDQDPTDGLLSLIAGYTMFVNVSEFEYPAKFANAQKWAMEHRYYHVFGDGARMLNLRLNWRSQRGWTLKSNECFAFYQEVEAGSNNSITRMWARTLVGDEG